MRDRDSQSSSSKSSSLTEEMRGGGGDEFEEGGVEGVEGGLDVEQHCGGRWLVGTDGGVAKGPASGVTKSGQAEERNVERGRRCEVIAHRTRLDCIMQ